MKGKETTIMINPIRGSPFLCFYHHIFFFSFYLATKFHNLVSTKLPSQHTSYLPFQKNSNHLFQQFKTTLQKYSLLYQANYFNFYSKPSNQYVHRLNIYYSIFSTWTLVFHSSSRYIITYVLSSSTLPSKIFLNQLRPIAHMPLGFFIVPYKHGGVTLKRYGKERFSLFHLGYL